MEDIRIVTVNTGKPGGFAPLLEGVPGTALPDVVVYGAKSENIAVGVLVASIRWNVINIEHIGIDPTKEEFEVADALVGRLFEAAKQLKLECVRGVHLTGEPEFLKELYERRGMSVTQSVDCYSFRLSVLLDGPLGKKLEVSERVINFDKVTNHQLEEFDRKLGSSPRLRNVKSRMGDVLPDVSYAIVENKHLTGCVLVSRCGDGVVVKALFGNGTRDTVALLQSALCSANKLLGKDTLIYVAAFAESVNSLVEKLAGGNFESTGQMNTYEKKIG